MPAELHFLRPEWFLALPILLLIWPLTRRHANAASSWEQAIEPRLLKHLLDRTITRVSTPPYWLLGIAWIITLTALAGPAWRQIPQPVQEKQDALIVLLDLSLSMRSTDVRPDRLTAAKRKLRDLLYARAEGVTGLIVYARDAHTVVPLTDDANTIVNILPALDPSIMPMPGSRLGPALELASELQRGGGVTSGRLLIITDEIRDPDAALAAVGTYEIAVLGVGTAIGAPIPLESGYLKDSSGVMVMPSLDADELRAFAERAGGRFATLTLGDADLDYLLAQTNMSNVKFRAVDRDFDVWFEEGPWLVLLLLPLSVAAFRRGWLWSIVIVLPLAIGSEPAYALEWRDLWQTADQRGAEALAGGDASAAAQTFTDPRWKATARYRAGDYEAAADDFGAAGTPTGYYNEGNALARLGKLDEALLAYDKTLATEPDHDDARFNHELIQKLLQQRQQQSSELQDEEQNELKSTQESDQADSQQEGERDDVGEPSQTQPGEGESGQGGEPQTAANGEGAERPPPKQLDEGSDGEESDQKAQPATADYSNTEGEQQMVGTEGQETEAEQALRQWLQRVPDDPGGLLRAKFRRKSAERRDPPGREGDADVTW